MTSQQRHGCNIMDIYRQREIRGNCNHRHVLNILLETSYFEDNHHRYQKSMDQSPTSNHLQSHEDSDGATGPEDLALNDSVLSTIAIAISPDGETIATSHGDHTIKVFLYHTGKQYRIFRYGIVSALPLYHITHC